jgi:outer membrane immunogenic protein
VRNNVFRAGVNYRFFDANRAYAADMPLLAAPPPRSWDGFYAGLNAGYGVARSPTSFTAVGFQPQNESFSLNPAGWIGGGQIGFNRQFAPTWVAGLEADIQAAGQKSSEVCAVICSVATPIYVAMDQKLKWFGTVRGRLGWVTGPALLYATGGFAYGQVNTRVGYFAQAFLGGAPNPTSIFDMSSTKAGWTVGGGLETAIAGPWTVKLEYLYLDLGSQTASAPNDFGLGFTVVTTANARFRENVVRVGVNYKFN